MPGYSTEDYARTCSHLGEPVRMTGSDAWLLRRNIPGSELTDLVGPYPIFCSSKLGELRVDLERLESDDVSLTCVLDPLETSAGIGLATEVFPDLLVPFKRHFFVDLRSDFAAARSSHHRRSVSRASRNVEVNAATDPGEHVQEWAELYDSLRQDKRFQGGPSDFSESALEAQLELPGVSYYRATSNGTCVAASLWIEHGDRIYYHLGASSDRGRSLKASFSIFDRALGDAASRGLSWACLGGAAGLKDDAADGLAFFKRGWATDTHTAYLAGRVLNRGAYEALCGATMPRGGYFPAYRGGSPE